MSRRPDYNEIIRLELEVYGQQLTTTDWRSQPIAAGTTFCPPLWLTAPGGG